MKHIFSPVAIACSIIATPIGAQTVEFYQLSTASLQAPLPVIPRGTSYIANFPYTKKSPTVLWGTATNGSYPVIPSIRFNAYDDKGVKPEDKCPSLTSPPIPFKVFPKHLGTDYAAPEGTPVYAIADGIIRRVNTFSTKMENGKSTPLGDYYVVVESGSSDKWTTVYGHLQKPPSYPPSYAFWTNKFDLNIFVRKGEEVGRLFNYTSHGDVPHLHMGIHRGAYNPNAANASEVAKGYVCEVNPNTLQFDSTYYSNRYNFVSPEQFRYYTPYYWYQYT